jgi:hypothetical protein
MSSLENPNDVPDAAYIVAACNAAPALIAEIEYLGDLDGELVEAQMSLAKAKAKIERLTAQVEEMTNAAKPCALAGSDDEQEQR